MSLLYNSSLSIEKREEVDIENFLNEEPEGSNPAVSALWWEAKGDWDKAHKLVQNGNQDKNWVHTHLHRV